MTAVSLPYESSSFNTSIANPTGTALSLGDTDGYTIADAVPEETFLCIRNTANTVTGTIIVAAGDNPPASTAGLGAITTTIVGTTNALTTGTKWVGPFESARVLQNDGSMTITISGAAFTGSIQVFRVKPAV
jgi:hypothetical protein